MDTFHSDGLQSLAHLVGIAITQSRRELLLQSAEDFGSSHQSAHILVTTIDTLASGLDAEGVQSTLVHQLEGGLSLRVVFCLFRQDVEAES